MFTLRSPLAAAHRKGTSVPKLQHQALAETTGRERARQETGREGDPRYERGDGGGRPAEGGKMTKKELGIDLNKRSQNPQHYEFRVFGEEVEICSYFGHDSVHLHFSTEDLNRWGQEKTLAILRWFCEHKEDLDTIALGNTWPEYEYYQAKAREAAGRVGL